MKQSDFIMSLVDIAIRKKQSDSELYFIARLIRDGKVNAVTYSSDNTFTIDYDNDGIRCQLKF
jgi:diacylglycerol kinase family enzyme